MLRGALVRVAWQIEGRLRTVRQPRRIEARGRQEFDASFGSQLYGPCKG